MMWQPIETAKKDGTMIISNVELIKLLRNVARVRQEEYCKIGNILELIDLCEWNAAIVLEKYDQRTFAISDMATALKKAIDCLEAIPHQERVFENEAINDAQLALVSYRKAFAND